MNVKHLISAVLAASVLAGCASSSVLVGQARPPIAVSAVKLYLTPPKRFEEVALLQSSSQSSFTFSDQRMMDTVIARLKQEAAKVGANGVLLRSTGDQPSGSIGIGGINGGFGLGTGVALMNKSGSGVAIYVIEE